MVLQLGGLDEALITAHRTKLALILYVTTDIKTAATINSSHAFNVSRHTLDLFNFLNPTRKFS